MRSGLLFVLCLQLCSVSVSAAAEFWVPDDFLTIQEAIDAANAGDHVFVRAGTYPGAVTLKDRVSLSSEDGAVATVIDGQNAEHTIDARAVTALEVTGFTVTGGQSPTNGGGMRIWDGASVTVTGCIFVDNTAAGSGGGLAILDSNAAVNDCEFFSNSASGGGAIYTEGTALTTVTFSGCNVHDNTASGPGAGMQATQGTVSIQACVFARNETTVGIGGGISFNFAGGEVTDSVFYLNAATDGGGISCHNVSSPDIHRCTFYKNSSDPTLGGAISSTNDSRPDIRWTILSFSTEGKGLHCAMNTPPTVTCCCFFGNVGGDTSCGTALNNVLADPAFCELAPDVSGNFAIQSDSPCAPSNSPCGELIGRDPVGCGTDPVDPATWGGVKSTYR